jgi:hypothetical protein
MKKKRTKVPNGRPKPTPKKKNKSPWHRYRTIPPKPITAPPVVDREEEIVLGAKSLDDEIAEIEADENAEPEEIPED